MRRARELARAPLDAIAFLTIIPASSGEHAPTAAAAASFPLVGALVGALAGGVRSAALKLLGHGPSTVLALVAIVAVTGALHQDGLADSFDGVGVRGDRARRLDAMRDHAIGAFGVLALIGWALLLYTALAPLTGPRGFKTLIVAGALSRAAILLHGRKTPPARDDGLGAAMHVTTAALLIGAATTAVLAFALFGWAEGAIALGVSAAIALAWSVFSRHAFGGRTGDTLGATSALTELAVCLTLLAGA